MTVKLDQFYSIFHKNRSSSEYWKKTNFIFCQGEKSTHPSPEPYSFSYSSVTHDGSKQIREEKGDKNGRVTGFYMIFYPNDVRRRVKYACWLTIF